MKNKIHQFVKLHINLNNQFVMQLPKSLWLGTISFLFIAFHASSFADNRHYFANKYVSKTPMEFSLSFINVDIELKTNKITYPVNNRRISASMLDILDPNFQYGFILGSSFLNMRNDIATAGLNLAGHHLGLAIRGFTGSNPQLGFNAQYIFQESKDENTQHAATLTWHEWLAEAQLKLGIGSRWSIAFGGGMTGLSADRRVSGDLNETLRMKLKPGFQGSLEFNIYTQNSGEIGLAIQRGNYNGASLSFARSF